jgi:hypothetical protein
MGESNVSFDTNVLMSSFNSIGESIKDFINLMTPYFIGIGAVALIIFFGIWSFKMIKKWFSNGSNCSHSNQGYGNDNYGYALSDGLRRSFKK